MDFIQTLIGYLIKRLIHVAQIVKNRQKIEETIKIVKQKQKVPIFKLVIKSCILLVIFVYFPTFFQGSKAFIECDETCFKVQSINVLVCCVLTIYYRFVPVCFLWIILFYLTLYSRPKYYILFHYYIGDCLSLLKSAPDKKASSILYRLVLHFLQVWPSLNIVYEPSR